MVSDISHLHPATNAVQVVLEKSGEGLRSAMFLFTYRLTLHTTIGVSPDDMLLGKTT